MTSDWLPLIRALIKGGDQSTQEARDANQGRGIDADQTSAIAAARQDVRRGKKPRIKANQSEVVVQTKGEGRLCLLSGS